MSPTPSTPHTPPRAVPPIRRRAPYAIERFPALGGCVLLIGYDRAGAVMIELRVPASWYSAEVLACLREWMRANDEAPPLTLLP